jgi:radical SAM protein with 4Fe4S-binding SPASM domain
VITAEKVRSFLDNSFVQWNLKQLAKRDKEGRTLVDRIFAAYVGEEKTRPKYLPYYFLISLLPGILKVDKATLEEAYAVRQNRKAMANICASVSEYGLNTPQLFSAPLLTVWNFTNACNLKCKHCYQSASRALPDELTLKERLAVIDELDKNDVSLLAFSGGEPLMHPDFWPVASYAHEKGMHLSVATNGTLITKEVAGRLKEIGIDYVEISIDSVDPEKHDAFRGGPGHWKRAIEGIKNTVAADGPEVGMAATITRKNFDEMDDLIGLAKNLKVNSFYVFNFIPTGRGRGMVEEDLTPAMREEMLRTLYDTLLEKEIFAFTTCPQYGRICYQNGPDDIIVNAHYNFLDLKGAEAKMLADYIGGCGAGRAYCAIQPNGKVTPCVFMPEEIVGDLRAERLSAIWKNSEVMKIMRNRAGLSGHCGTCDYRAMCGGCRARAYGYFDDFMGPDPGCENNMSAWEYLNAMQNIKDKDIS